MATVTAADTDGYVRRNVTGGPTWASVRDASSGNQAKSSITRYTTAVMVQGGSSRGGFYYVYRSFFAFDTSGIDFPPSAATLKIYGYGYNNADVIAVRATAPDLSTNLVTGNYNAIDGFVGGASMSGNATDYSSEITTWSTSGYNDITLTNDALIDMAANDILKIALVEYDYDYLNVDPGGSTAARTGLYYEDYSGTGTDPYIDYTPSTISQVNDVAAASISQFNDVAVSSIKNISGVD